MALATFLVKFLPYLMVFQSGESSSKEESSSTPSPFKTKFKLLGWLFGNPLATFDNLIPVTYGELKFEKSQFSENKKHIFWGS